MKTVYKAAGSLIIGAAILAACGGSPNRIASANNPPPAPTPSPSPTPTPSPSPEPPVPPPPPEGPIGLVSSEPFAVLGVSNDYAKGADGNFTVSDTRKAEISFEYRVSDGTYVITIPGFRTGSLYTSGYSGSFISGAPAWLSIYGSSNDLLDGESGRQDARVFLRWPSGPLNDSLPKLSYTSRGSWDDDWKVDGQSTSATMGLFAYGIPTKPGEMPTSGTATYTAEVRGTSNQPYPGSGDTLWLDSITGSALLRFNFGAGTLEGEMNPALCPWDCYSLGTYSFIQTVYSSGSTSFSGQFAINGEAVPSWFEGSFNGPQASELMARWQAPYTYEGAAGTMGGIWIGTRD